MELGRMKTGYSAIARASHVPLIINAQKVLAQNITFNSKLAFRVSRFGQLK